MDVQDCLPKQGLLSIAPSLDAPGVVAKTVADAAVLLAALQDKVRMLMSRCSGAWHSVHASVS